MGAIKIERIFKQLSLLDVDPKYLCGVSVILNYIALDLHRGFPGVLIWEGNLLVYKGQKKYVVKFDDENTAMVMFHALRSMIEAIVNHTIRVRINEHKATGNRHNKEDG